MCGIIVGGVPAIPAFMAARLKIVETAIVVAITIIVVIPGKFALYNAFVRSKMAVSGRFNRDSGFMIRFNLFAKQLANYFPKRMLFRNQRHNCQGTSGWLIPEFGDEISSPDRGRRFWGVIAINSN